MALHFETDLYAAVVDLGKAVVPAVRSMPRDVKQLLGGRILDEALWMGVLVMRINKARDAAKLPVIEDLLEHLELAQMTLHLTRELKYIANKHFANALPLIASIGKQAHGLRNHFAPA